MSSDVTQHNATDPGSAELPYALRAAIGNRIVRLWLLEFFFKGEQDADDTPIQIEFDNGAILRLDAAGDGEALRVHTDAWKDPFSEPMPSENAEFVKTHGKWMSVDVSRNKPFAGLIGQTISAVTPIWGPNAKLIGVSFVAGSASFSAFVEWDALKVRNSE